MISVVNGHDVANKQSLRNKWDIGNHKVTVLKSGYMQGDNRKFNEDSIVPSKDDAFNRKNVSKAREERDKQEQETFQQRRAKQMPFLLNYVENTTTHRRWARVVDIVGNIVSANQLGCAFSGTSSIKCPDVWRKVEEAINQILGDKK